ncbi:hypothetical protein PENTCL1PPCAC_15441, partial [Pristionchus entomophagus]
TLFFSELRFTLYKWHVRCTIFCSCFEIALSIERILSIIMPRRYHFSDIAWKTLVSLTVCIWFVNFTRIFLHQTTSEDHYAAGLAVSTAIEVSVLAAGTAGMRVCKARHVRMYGKASLTERYQVYYEHLHSTCCCPQVKEAYEMSRAVIPTYITSFCLKVYLSIDVF